MRNPARVLHVLGGMDRGGAETLVMNLYREVDRTELQFDFAVQTDRRCHYDSEIESLGGRILQHPVPAHVGLRAYAKSLRQTLTTRGPFAAVHSHVHFFSGVVLQASKRLGVPVRISHSHSTGNLTGTPIHRQAYARYMRYLIRASATHLLGCSRQACEALFGAGCWSDGRVQMVPNAIRLSDYTDSAHSGRFLRDELGVPEATPLVGHVGSFTEPKNHTFAIEVFRHLRDRLPAVHFVLAGDGHLRPRIEESIRNNGLSDSVHLLGIREDIPRIMGALNLLLLPSRWEGLPVVLVEAQAAGLPCLVADTITREADLKAGLVHFASLDDGPEHWADQSLAHLETARLSRAESEWALRKAGYDIRAVTPRLAAIYANGGSSWTS